jgi:uncharacterized protein YhbP (UPF0306 family)
VWGRRDRDEAPAASKIRPNRILDTMTDSSRRAAAIDYLTSHNVMTLATSGREGVWAAAVFYVSDAFTLYYLSSPASRHSLNVSENPAVSAAIQEDYRDWQKIRGIQLGGSVVSIEGTEQVRAMTLYCSRHPAVAKLMKDPSHEIAAALLRMKWYKLVPTRVYFIDNSIGLGHRDEVF